MPDAEPDEDPPAEVEPTGSEDPAAEAKPTRGEDPAAEAEPTGSEDPAAEAEPIGSEDPAAEAEPTGGEDPAAEDEQRRQFRAALERKNKYAQDAVGGDPANAGKIHDAHGPAGGRRSFRRKSG